MVSFYKKLMFFVANNFFIFAFIPFTTLYNFIYLRSHCILNHVVCKLKKQFKTNKVWQPNFQRDLQTLTRLKTIVSEDKFIFIYIKILIS